jgi:S1-C subfamily serine protease
MHDDVNRSTASDAGGGSTGTQLLGASLRRAWPLAAGVVVVLLGVLLYNLLFPPPIPLTEEDVADVAVQAMASATPPPAHSAEVYQAILPSLVFIQTESEDRQLEEGFGVGAGVVINDQGDILTAFHVVDGAAGIELVYADGSHVGAELIEAEPENDIAVLHPIEPPDLIVPAILGNPNTMRIGDETFAVGNPLGLVGSMSAGVISGFNRTLPLEDDQEMEGLIQFDAAVNPGNSGGPLLNRDGQVVGIVTALANPSEQNFFIGIGFAVPIGTAVSAAGGPAY